MKQILTALLISAIFMSCTKNQDYITTSTPATPQVNSTQAAGRITFEYQGQPLTSGQQLTVGEVESTAVVLIIHAVQPGEAIHLTYGPSVGGNFYEWKFGDVGNSGSVAIDIHVTPATDLQTYQAAH